MPSLDLIVRNITNLTDARYFAALLPSYLVAPVADPASDSERVASWQSWVEGPHWAVEFLTDMDPQAPTAVDFSAHGLETLMGTSDQVERFGTFFHQKIVRLKNEISASYLSQVIAFTLAPDCTFLESFRKATSKSIYVEISSEEQWRSFLPLRDLIDGIVLTGGVEEKVGLKSFEATDRLIDLIFS